MIGKHMVTLFTYLRVTIADNMTWNTHIEQTAAQGNKKTGLLKRNLKSITQTSRATPTRHWSDQLSSTIAQFGTHTQLKLLCSKRWSNVRLPVG